MQDTLMVAQIIQSAVTTIAIVLGGLWTYFRFFRGRTFHPRINLSIAGSTLTKESTVYVKVSIKIENTGNAVVHIDQDRTYIAIYNEHGQPGFGERVDVFRILRNCNMVEPQESVVDEQLSRLDTNPDVALRLVFHVQSKRYLSWQGFRVSRWVSSVIVAPVVMNTNAGG